MALSNTQYNTLIRRYEDRQLENQHVVSKRIQSLYGQFPRLSQIDDSISSISLAQGRKLLEGDEDALAAPEKRALLDSGNNGVEAFETRIRKLKIMYENGIISDREFEAEKRKMLSEI